MKGEIIETISSGDAITALTKAECDLQIQTAHQFPRDIQRFKENAMSMATADVTTASDMFYALPRGGKSIEGPSVRLAEVVASTYGNLRVQSMITAMDDKFVTARGMCHDLENNLAVMVDVRRRITDRNGRRYNDDMIVTTSNAACAVAFREAVFKVVPRHFTNSFYEEARHVAIGDVRSLANKRAAMIAYFQKMGISPAQLCAVVNVVDEDEIGLTELATLKGIATALKDGEASIDDMFTVELIAKASPPEKKLSGKDLLGGTAASEPSPKKKVTKKKAAKKKEEYPVADDLMERAKNISKLDSYDPTKCDEGAVSHATEAIQQAATADNVVDFVQVVFADEAYNSHEILCIATLAAERLANLSLVS
jgi:hypothetical protein